jgi:hypothetical protein
MSAKSFIRINVIVDVNIVHDRTTVDSYKKKSILVTPLRALSDELLQGPVVESVLDKVADRLEAVNHDYAEKKSKTPGTN